MNTTINFRMELVYLIDDYCDEYCGGDRQEAIKIWRSIYRKIGRTYSINVNIEAQTRKLSKVQYLEQNGLIEEAYYYGKKLIDNRILLIEKDKKK